jgi:mono/diheme cytochrome c family protein
MPGLFDRITKRAETPIEHRSYGGVYLLLSGLLFVGTMWSVIDEVSTRRPWKEYQETYLTMSEEGWRNRLEETRTELDSTELLALFAVRDSLAGVMESAPIVAALQSVDEIDHQLLDANRAVTFSKSKGDEAYYFWKKSVHEGHEDIALRDETARLGAELESGKMIVDSLTIVRDGFARAVDEVRSAQKEVNRRIAELLKDASEAERKLEVAANSPIQIKQVMMNGFDLSNFGIPKPRIDRCQTCHSGWKNDMMEEAPQPFTMHPLPGLLKVHDPEVFGCTPCHHGQGAALTAGMAHGDEDHYWEWPLLKGEEVYASCNSCHEQELYLKEGGRFNKGKQVLLESGCYGCHEIKGFADLPKIGPDLTQLSAKLDPQWLFRWIRNPKEYNPHTRMPDFRLDDAQSEAVAAFVMHAGDQNGVTGSSRKTPVAMSRGGDASRGKELVGTIGCKGCHVIGDDERMRKERGFSYDMAPELTRAGSKLDPEWLFRWLKNPREYRPATQMPNMRLSDQEAKDIVAYIMTLKDGRKFEAADLDLSSAEKQQAGFRIAREYGCAGCHNIPGLEKENKVSVSLSNLGRKRIDEIDFGDTKVPHRIEDAGIRAR